MLQRRILLARVILACVAAIQQAMVSSALVCSASMDVIIHGEAVTFLVTLESYRHR